ncbi:MAG: hypothetical protein AAF672_08680 [Pseudomonadota bacterium]
MLRITPQQFDAVSAQRELSFFEDLRAELRAFMAREMQDMEGERVERRISSAFEACRAHGFTTEKQITELSFILVTFPSDYAQKPGYAWLDGLLRANAAPRVRLEHIKSVIRAGAA